eukprot:2856704-Prymnesium_polylepis.1
MRVCDALGGERHLFPSDDAVARRHVHIVHVDVQHRGWRREQTDCRRLQGRVAPPVVVDAAAR